MPERARPSNVTTAHHTRGWPVARRTWRARCRSVAPAVLMAVALSASIGAFLFGVRTASGRFGGTTANEGSLLTAANVELRLGAGAGDPVSADASSALVISARNLVPGDRMSRCITVSYRGDVDGAELRLIGRRDGGSGLDGYLSSVVVPGHGSDPACSDFVATDTAFEGTLAELSSDHGTSATGVLVADGLADGAAVTVRIDVELVDDDAAQGLDTVFWLVLEVRP